MIELGAVGVFHHGTFIFEGSIFWKGKLEPEIKISFYVLRFDMTTSQKWSALQHLQQLYHSSRTFGVSGGYDYFAKNYKLHF